MVSYKSVTTFEGLTLNPVPSCPIVTYPLNDAIFIPLSPVFTWNPVNGAVSYKVSIGTTPGGTDVANQVVVTTNSYTPTTPFSVGANLYLRIVSVGATAESSGCTEINFSTLPPPPTNDDCDDAVVLTVNPDLNCGVVTAGYTLGATDSGLVPDPCYGDPDDDVWFKFVATATSHVVSLTNVVSVGSVVDDTDTYFQVFGGSCSGLTSVLCSDSDSSVVPGLVVGETYYVRVYSYYDSGSRQSFDICIGTFPPPPANDSCGGAINAVSFPFNYVQNDAAGATNNTGMVAACGSGMNDGTWFSFVGDGTVHNISVTLPASSSFDPAIGVYTGACSNFTCEVSVDNSGQGGAENVSVPTVPGITYYVNVGYYSGSDDELEGTFTINILKNNLSVVDVKNDKKSLQVYPNPFSDVLNISDIKNVKSILIVDFMGRLVKTIEKPTSALQLKELNSGVYMVILNMNDGSRQTIKAIKK